MTKQPFYSKICTLCNGMDRVAVPCPRCGTLREDTGSHEDYLDDYSPYQGPGADRDHAHIFTCPRCGFEDEKFIPLKPC